MKASENSFFQIRHSIFIFSMPHLGGAPPGTTKTYICGSSFWFYTIRQTLYHLLNKVYNYWFSIPLSKISILIYAFRYDILNFWVLILCKFQLSFFGCYILKWDSLKSKLCIPDNIFRNRLLNLVLQAKYHPQNVFWNLNQFL